MKHITLKSLAPERDDTYSTGVENYFDLLEELDREYKSKWMQRNEIKVQDLKRRIKLQASYNRVLDEKRIETVKQ